MYEKHMQLIPNVIYCMCVPLYCNFDGMSNIKLIFYNAMGCFFIQQENVHFLFYEEIWEADEQHKRKKKRKIKVDSQITIAQTSELSSFKRQNINAQILSVSNLYSIQYMENCSCSVLLSKSFLSSFR